MGDRLRVELRAVAFVMHRWLGMTWNPLGITRQWRKWMVTGRLIAGPASGSDRRRRYAARAIAPPPPPGTT